MGPDAHHNPPPLPSPPKYARDESCAATGWVWLCIALLCMHCLALPILLRVPMHLMIFSSKNQIILANTAVVVQGTDPSPARKKTSGRPQRMSQMLKDKLMMTNPLAWNMFNRGAVPEQVDEEEAGQIPAGPMSMELIRMELITAVVLMVITVTDPVSSRSWQSHCEPGMGWKPGQTPLHALIGRTQGRIPVGALTETCLPCHLQRVTWQPRNLTSVCNLSSLLGQELASLAPQGWLKHRMQRISKSFCSRRRNRRCCRHSQPAWHSQQMQFLFTQGTLHWNGILCMIRR